MNVLKPENYINRINSYSEKDWKPLLDLIPEIEKVDKFGDDTKAIELLEKGIFDIIHMWNIRLLKSFVRLVMIFQS